MMLRSKNLILILAVVLTMVMLGVTPTFAAYNLVWSDEFNGSSLNGNNWVYDVGGGGWGNAELEYYTSGSNVTVANGILTITAKRESMGGYSFTSSRIKTKGKYDFTYGKVEARILTPKGIGIWPAFWMLGANIDSVSWPSCGEIDIMEQKNNEATNYGTMHWQGPSGYAYYGGNTGASVGAWHVYSIEWTSSYIRWFVDGVQYHEANIAGGINSTEEFSRPFFILLNLAIGGNFTGYNTVASITASFPAQYQIDYVRVYQDNGTPVATPTPSPAPTQSGAPASLVNNAIYRIEPACAPGKALDVAEVSTADGANVHIWTYVGGANQQWKAVDVGGGYWKFLPQHAPGKALDVYAASSADNTNVQQYTDNSSNAQKWKLYDAGNGYIKLEPACAPGKVLDVYYGTNADGTNVEIYTALGNTAQQWKFYNLGAPNPTPTATRTPSPGVTPTVTKTPTPSGGGSTWQPNTYYAVGVQVTYGGHTYKCLQAHTSLVGWEPPNVPALWQLIS